MLATRNSGGRNVPVLLVVSVRNVVDRVPLTDGRWSWTLWPLARRLLGERLDDAAHAF